MKQKASEEGFSSLSDWGRKTLLAAIRDKCPPPWVLRGETKMRILQLIPRLVVLVVGLVYFFGALRLVTVYPFNEGVWSAIGYLWGVSGMGFFSIVLLGIGLGVWTFVLIERPRG